MKYKKLFESFKLGSLNLPSRIVMAPMTRCRAGQPGNMPTDMMAKYYAQRASAALIITEGTQITPRGQGYSFTPGIHSDEQVENWKKVTKAVHEKNGRIFVQLWHVGRMSHESFHNGKKPLAPSAIKPDAKIWFFDGTSGGMVECPEPQAMTSQDIKDAVEQYRIAARNALQAGFDGVEIHGANGYLIDQFMRRTSNTRTDEYGGSIENRIRFAREVVQAVVEEAGAYRTGIRLSPFMRQRGMDDPESEKAILAVSSYLNEMKIAYIHLAEADWDDAPQVPETFRHELRKNFNQAIMVAGRYTPERAEKLLESKLVDLVAFGRAFIANPDYPMRIQNNYPVNSFDASSLYAAGERGYIDYPVFSG